MTRVFVRTIQGPAASDLDDQYPRSFIYSSPPGLERLKAVLEQETARQAAEPQGTEKGQTAQDETADDR
jgi:hypothetical protein